MYLSAARHLNHHLLKNMRKLPFKTIEATFKRLKSFIYLGDNYFQNFRLVIYISSDIWSEIQFYGEAQSEP